MKKIANQFPTISRNSPYGLVLVGVFPGKVRKKTIRIKIRWRPSNASSNIAISANRDNMAIAESNEILLKFSRLS